MVGATIDNRDQGGLHVRAWDETVIRGRGRATELLCFLFSPLRRLPLETEVGDGRSLGEFASPRVLSYLPPCFPSANYRSSRAYGKLLERCRKGRGLIKTLPSSATG